MSTPIYIPKLGMTMAEAKVVEWKGEEGDWVETDQVVLVIETDKVTYEVKAPASGFLHITRGSEEVLAVGEAAGYIAETEEELAEIRKTAPVSEKDPQEVFVAAQRSKAQGDSKGDQKIKASPAARKMAEKHGLDLAFIAGSGPGGRIVRADVEEAIKSGARVAPPLKTGFDGRTVKTVIPLKGMQRSIAEHMVRSLSVSAQLTNFGEFDGTAMVRLRERFLEQEDRIGLRITYNEIWVFILSRALKDYPLINSSLIENEIMIWGDINIGVAVAIDQEGLIVPVIRNADKKSLMEISQTLKEIIQKARSGDLLPDDVNGGTFTLTSVAGHAVSRFSTPIINQPEAAIFMPGAIEERPVVRRGRIEIAPVMPYSFTYDHRIVNGLSAEMFLGRVRELVESPGLLVL